MRWGALLGVMLCTACGPLADFSVAIRPSEQVAVLPVKCRGSVGRTTTGVWACESDGPFASRIVVISRGNGDSETISGEHVAVAGASVWTWNTNSALSHFEEDALAPVVLRSPDVAFSWSALSPTTRNDLRSLVAREREIVITTSIVRTIAALPNRLEIRSEIPSGYSFLAHNGNSTHGLLDLGTILWGYGPTDASWAFCSYPFDSELGAAVKGSCSPAPSTLVGIANGGMWAADGPDDPVHFYRPVDGTMAKVERLELPSFAWVRGGVPWTIDPADGSLLVPRLEGDRLIIDRYKGSERHEWAGASEDWVFEVAKQGWGASTRVYRR